MQLIRKWSLLPLALLGAWLTAPAVAQLPEDAGLTAKAHADYATMRHEFARLLAEAVAVDHRDDDAAARAEYCATMMLLLLTEGSDTTSQSAVEAAREGPLCRHHPALRARLGSLLLQARRQHGGDVAALAAELGVIDQLWICGPFDNERGAGYATAHEPELRFDAEASYDGKLHTVRWRELPVRPPGGQFDLDEVQRPNEQVLAYLATAIVAERAQDAALWLGSTGAVRVYLNGAEVFARDVERVLHEDQDACVLPLQAGHNLLIVKACHQQGPDYGVRLRLSQPGGEPLADVRCSALRDDLERANGQQARAPTDGVQIDLNARTICAERAAQGDAAAALRLCAILTHEHVDGDRDKRPQELAQQAADGLPECAEAAFLRFWTRPRLIGSAADRDENPQRRDLAEVLRRDPGHVEARLLLSMLDLNGSRLFAKAERDIDRAFELQPETSVAAFNRALLLRMRELPALADRELEKVTDMRTVSTNVLEQLFYSRRDRGELRGASEVVERLLGETTLPRPHVAAAELWLRTGERERALTTLHRTMQRWPMERAPRQVIADLLAAEGDLEGALAAWTEWLEISPQDDAALLAVAGLHGLRDDRERQTEFLRAAIDLNPNLANEQRYLDYLTSDQKPFYEAFELDAEQVIAADIGPPDDAGESKDALHHLLQQRVIKAFANGTTSEYVHHITRVLREEGAQQLATWRLPYHYGSQRGRILSCTVRHADGTVEHPRLRGAWVRLQSLRVGDIVDVRGRIDDIAPTFFGTYFGLEHHFPSSDGNPIARSQLTVIATAGRDYVCQNKNGAPEPRVSELDDGSRRYDWQMAELPRDLPEIARPEDKELVPLVRMTTYRDWDHFASWWWNLIEKQIDVSQPMRDKVRELCADKQTPRERLDAIYRFVTTDVRYEAWEFGVHGYKPYNTSVIFERRHGDCKDKALLLCALLKEVDIVARPVLIFAADRRTEDDLSVPLVNHFNHCIAWLPEQDGIAAQFVDGTANLHPSDTLPEMDQGAHVLVVEPEGAELLHVPLTTPDVNAARVEFAVALQEDGSADVSMTRTPTGNQGVHLRFDLVSAPATLREQLERRLLARFGSCRIGDVQTSDGDDLAAAAELRVKFHADEMARRQGEQLVFKPSFRGAWLQQLAAAPERHAPLLLGVPNGDSERLLITPPAGMTARSLPQPIELHEPFGSYQLAYRPEGDRIVIERTLQLKTPRIDVADYEAFRAFVAAVQDGDAAVLVLEPKETR